MQSFECEFIKTIIKTFETMKMKISEWNSTWTFLHSILERWPPSIIILWVSTLGQNPPMSSPVICKLYPLILRQKRSYVLWHRWKTYLNAKHAAIKFITFHSGWVGGFFSRHSFCDCVQWDNSNHCKAFHFRFEHMTWRSFACFSLFIAIFIRI